MNRDFGRSLSLKFSIRFEADSERGGYFTIVTTVGCIEKLIFDTNGAKF